MAHGSIFGIVGDYTELHGSTAYGQFMAAIEIENVLINAIGFLFENSKAWEIVDPDKPYDIDFGPKMQIKPAWRSLIDEMREEREMVEDWIDWMDSRDDWE